MTSREIAARPERARDKDVLVRVLPTRDLGGAPATALRWEATEITGPSFPTFDANLTLIADGSDATVIYIVGRYASRFGVRRSDRLRGHGQAASLTVNTLLRGIADHLTVVGGPPNSTSLSTGTAD